VAIGRTCVRELLFMSVTISLAVVMLQQRIVYDICATAEQQHEEWISGAGQAAPSMGSYWGFRCSSQNPGASYSFKLAWPTAWKDVASYPGQLVAGAKVSSCCCYGSIPQRVRVQQGGWGMKGWQAESASSEPPSPDMSVPRPIYTQWPAGQGGKTQHHLLQTGGLCCKKGVRSHMLASVLTL
jgi:hypothetical protein